MNRVPKVLSEQVADALRSAMNEPDLFTAGVAATTEKVALLTGRSRSMTLAALYGLQARGVAERVDIGLPIMGWRLR